MENMAIGFYNGDLRSVYMANNLSKRYTVNTYNIDNPMLNNCNIMHTPEELFKKSDIIIPPVSLFINNDEEVNRFISLVTEGKCIFGGCLPSNAFHCAVLLQGNIHSPYADDLTADTQGCSPSVLFCSEFPLR